MKFDEWYNSEYTKVLFNSISEDHIPKTDVEKQIKKAKCRALLDAANWFETVDKDIAEPFVELRRMAYEQSRIAYELECLFKQPAHNKLINRNI